MSNLGIIRWFPFFPCRSEDEAANTLTRTPRRKGSGGGDDGDGGEAVTEKSSAAQKEDDSGGSLSGGFGLGGGGGNSAPVGADGGVSSIRNVAVGLILVALESMQIYEA